MPSDTLIAQHGGRETILVVEDEEMLRSLVREILTRAGYEVLEAVDGEDGVQMYREHHDRIHLVLLDYGLPKLAGDEVFAELRQDPAGRARGVQHGVRQEGKDRSADRAGSTGESFTNRSPSPKC